MFICNWTAYVMCITIYFLLSVFHVALQMNCQPNKGFTVKADYTFTSKFVNQIYRRSHNKIKYVYILFVLRAWNERCWAQWACTRKFAICSLFVCIICIYYVAVMEKNTTKFRTKTKTSKQQFNTYKWLHKTVCTKNKIEKRMSMFFSSITIFFLTKWNINWMKRAFFWSVMCQTIDNWLTFRNGFANKVRIDSCESNPKHDSHGSSILISKQHKKYANDRVLSI